MRIKFGAGAEHEHTCISYIKIILRQKYKYGAGKKLEIKRGSFRWGM
jgi:hypothetical protein